ncbi:MULTISPECIES: 3-deoxy-D-manno-octulosonic acid transferase [unclassified Haematobacter]|uniref:3-deoxy-D-manno-octulosonic acid transferase n=1 Tax=unclassified Haematobacter TaxID=2640585 RepID=UPI0025C1A13E|nr:MULTISPECIES: glycosyltransferase N-terminal domain-containing protein [unclassified Haematobacter]
MADLGAQASRAENLPSATADAKPIAAGKTGGSFALRTYLRIGAAPPPGASDAGALLPARPEGTVLWFHLASAGHRAAADELVRRLRRVRPAAQVVMTGEETGTASPQTEAAASRFLEHWQPGLIVLVGGELIPAVIDAGHRRGTPIIVIDGVSAPARGGWRWWPGVSRAMLRRISRILVQDEAALRHWRRMGARPEQVEISGRLEEGHGALPCTEAERDDLAHMLRARPVWLAVGLPEAEEAVAIAAHRAALGLRHRLMMIVVPEDPENGPSLARRLQDDGWDVALRSREEEPVEAEQIYIADTEGELGLWYRLAPVTYFGGTLSGKGTPRHPYEAAALGSAILHGPKTGPHTAAYARLGRGGAARVLRGAPEFGSALSELLAPDRAAQMAHNAWEVTSSGAEVTDRVVELLLRALDEAAAAKIGGAG